MRVTAFGVCHLGEKEENPGNMVYLKALVPPWPALKVCKRIFYPEFQE